MYFSRPLILGLILLAGSAFAQATRTWVSGVGDDENFCSRTAPCKTLQGALVNTDVIGEIDTIDGGQYGPVTIDKSVTIDGAGGPTGVISAIGSGNAIVIDAGANGTVTLRRLNLQGYGTGQTGIQVISARSVHIEDCQINGFVGHAIDFSPAAGGKLFLKNVIASENGGNGVLMTTAGTTPVLGNFINFTANGNSVGIAAGANSRVTLVGSNVSGNAVNGLFAESGGSHVAELTVDHSLISENAVGATATGTGAIIRLSHSTLIDNVTGPPAALDSGRLMSYGNNQSYQVRKELSVRSSRRLGSHLGVWVARAASVFFV